jgi:hypothetical protein
MTGLEFLSGLNTIILTAAAVAGAITAVRGLNTWKKQLKWQSDHELARKILILLFKHRDAIASVRHPAIWNTESAAAMEGKDEPTDRDQKRFAETAAVYEKRWAKIVEVRAELYPALIEGDVVWGSDLHELVKPVFDLELELMMVIQTFLRASNPNASSAARKAADQGLKKKRDILYDDFTETDVFKSDYGKALAPLEEYLRGKIGGSR